MIRYIHFEDTFSLYVKRILCLVPVSVWSTNHCRTCIKHILFTFKIDRFKIDRSRTI
jgi:hypothetical protein